MFASTLPAKALTLAACGGLLGCAGGARATNRPTRAHAISWAWITRLLEGDLVSFMVQVAGDDGAAGRNRLHPLLLRRNMR